jgi:hypothetical protein
MWVNTEGFKDQSKLEQFEIKQNIGLKRKLAFKSL